MEPPPFGSGNSVRAESALETNAASMEPPPFGSGNMRGRPAPRSASWCFNGATVFRQWKLENRLRPLYEQMKLQWSHRLSAVETRRGRGMCTPSLGCFNGATAFRQWKRLGDGDGGARLMPLQWSHRLSAVETVGRLQPAPPTRVSQGASMEPPPFGSGNLSARRKRPVHWDVLVASMEPPPFGSGNAREQAPRHE